MEEVVHVARLLAQPGGDSVAAAARNVAGYLYTKELSASLPVFAASCFNLLGFVSIRPWPFKLSDCRSSPLFCSPHFNLLAACCSGFKCSDRFLVCT